ncbi:hypothetical protein B9Q03_13775, partial [Candidatus Marsarchaeota G2 archaeon OSP_D]
LASSFPREGVGEAWWVELSRRRTYGGGGTHPALFKRTREALRSRSKIKKGGVSGRPAGWRA